MSLQPLISVIIPSYQRTYTVLRAIESVYNQTYKNFEIILIDNNKVNSTFNEFLLKFVKNKFNNLKYIPFSTIQNGSIARNIGIQNSNGDYICFLDDDDQYNVNFFEIHLYNLHLNKSFYFSVSNYTYKLNSKIYKKSLFKSNDLNNLDIKILSGTILIPLSCMFFSKKVFEKINSFDISFQRHQDVEFLLRVSHYFKPLLIENNLAIINITKKYFFQNNTLGLIQLKTQFLIKFSFFLNRLPSKVIENVYKNHNVEICKICLLNRDYKLFVNYFLKGKIDLFTIILYVSYIIEGITGFNLRSMYYKVINKC